MTRVTEYRTVRITRIFMRMVGLWYAETPMERLFLRTTFVYAVLGFLIAIIVLGVDLYYCFDDFDALLSNLCATLLLMMILVKLGSFRFYRDTVHNLIRFAEKNFWHTTYDEFGTRILEAYDKLGMIMVYVFLFMVSIGTVSYIYAPFFEISETNLTEKILPFKLYFDFPYHSPYYEIAYAIQSFSTLYSGICVFCFDNFVSMFSFHVAAQLKILGHKVEVIVGRCVENTVDEKRSPETGATERAFKKLRSCVQQHEILLCYVLEMRRIFAGILLGQLLLSSALICFAGFQFLAVDTAIGKFIFAFDFLGGLTQLFIYTWTCNDIIVQSTAISDAAYNSKWYLLPGTGPGKALREGLIMIMIRARRPCTLTAGHFTIMSLDSFMGVLSTAMSYFTLLRRVSEQEI